MANANATNEPVCADGPPAAALHAVNSRALEIGRNGDQDHLAGPNRDRRRQLINLEQAGDGHSNAELAVARPPPDRSRRLHTPPPDTVSLHAVSNDTDANNLT